MNQNKLKKNNLKNDTEFITENSLPETLLVIGNGFDLSCNVPSNYKSFLEDTLEKNYNILKVSWNGMVMMIFLTILCQKLNDI